MALDAPRFDRPIRRLGADGFLIWSIDILEDTNLIKLICRF
jgi:hypothetical protein